VAGYASGRQKTKPADDPEIWPINTDLESA